MATANTVIYGTNNEGGIRARLKDTDDSAYGDDMLIDFINDGAEDFASTTGCCQQIVTSTPGGSNDYIAVDSDTITYKYLRIYAVEYGGTPLMHAPLYESRFWAAENGVPTAWTLWTDRIYFDTIPAITSDVTIWMTYVPARITSTSSDVDIPEKWLNAIKAYCEYRVHNANREDGLAARAWSEYESIRAVAAAANESVFGTGGYAK